MSFVKIHRVLCSCGETHLVQPGQVDDSEHGSCMAIQLWCLMKRLGIRVCPHEVIEALASGEHDYFKMMQGILPASELVHSGVYDFTQCRTGLIRLADKFDLTFIAREVDAQGNIKPVPTLDMYKAGSGHSLVYIVIDSRENNRHCPHEFETLDEYSAMWEKVKSVQKAPEQKAPEQKAPTGRLVTPREFLEKRFSKGAISMCLDYSVGLGVEKAIEMTLGKQNPIVITVFRMIIRDSEQKAPEKAPEKAPVYKEVPGLSGDQVRVYWLMINTHGYTHIAANTAAMQRRP